MIHHLVNLGLIQGRGAIKKVERQVVAGFNYKIVASVADSLREIVAYKKIDNSMEIMSN